MSDNLANLCTAINDNDERTWRRLLGVISNRQLISGYVSGGVTPLHLACLDNIPAMVALLEVPGMEVNLFSVILKV